jgi:adenosine deaminase
VTLGLPDLHRHLDGSLRDTTVVELAAAAGVALPAEPLRFRPGMGLPAALACFEVTLALLQEAAALRRVAAEIAEDAAAEGVTTLEVRFAPQLHRRRGLALEAVLDAVLEGLGGRAGLLLCGLYGESPEVLDALVAAAAPRPGVVGIDLAGGPASGDRFGLTDYAPAYRRAAELGLGRTVHAGEGRPPAEIRAAIELLGAQRIGHATTLLDDPAVVDLVGERRVTLEACPTSNVHTGVIAEVAAHPLPRWLAAGLRACVNTDNTLFSAVDAGSEHARAGMIPGMTPGLLTLALAHGHDSAFRRR